MSVANLISAVYELETLPSEVKRKSDEMEVEEDDGNPRKMSRKDIDMEVDKEVATLIAKEGQIVSMLAWQKIALDLLRKYGLSAPLRLCQIQSTAFRGICRSVDFWREAIFMYFGYSLDADKNSSDSRLVREKTAAIMRGVERAGAELLRSEEGAARLRQLFFVLVDSHRKPIATGTVFNRYQRFGFFTSYGVWQGGSRLRWECKLYLEAAALQVDGINKAMLGPSMLQVRNKFAEKRLMNIGTEEFFDRTLYLAIDNEFKTLDFYAYDIDKFELGAIITVDNFETTAYSIVSSAIWSDTDREQSWPMAVAFLPNNVVYEIGIYNPALVDDVKKRVADASDPLGEFARTQTANPNNSYFFVMRKDDRSPLRQIVKQVPAGLNMTPDDGSRNIGRIVVPVKATLVAQGTYTNFIYYVQNPRVNSNGYDAYYRKASAALLPNEIPSRVDEPAPIGVPNTIVKKQATRGFDMYKQIMENKVTVAFPTLPSLLSDQRRAGGLARAIGDAVYDIDMNEKFVAYPVRLQLGERALTWVGNHLVYASGSISMFSLRADLYLEPAVEFRADKEAN